jgi:dTDP-4-amino-4,6-dideoxygalactose transaminase
MRSQVASRYLSELHERYVKPDTAPGRQHVYHLFVIQSDKRDRLQEHLTNEAIQTQVHYPIPVHLQSVYRNLSRRWRDLTVTEQVTKRVLSLPMFPTITSKQVDRVVKVINAYAR